MAVNRADPEYLDAIWKFDVADVEGEYQVSNLRRVNSNARQAWADIHNTHKRKMGDSTKTEAGRLLESAKFAKAALQRQRADYEETRHEGAVALRATQAKLQRAMNPPSDPGEAALFGEILRHLRSLPIGDRIQMVFDATNPDTRDTRILHAAIACPKALGLLPPDLVGQFSDAFLVNTVPEEWGKAARLVEALERADAGLQQLEAHAKSIIDFNTAEAVERSAA